ncbi:putative metabolite transport protein [Colletotrichum chlorophyti]|uniref:Putative metabolite transport protein n=1 Tax=Colletotrichum chlorophyti TaxID=708187 RepID=A0A1Q8RRY0_9PEZI|nr:putative metabolite transport protein [Colletotrichum chlorophyti]
MAPSGLRQCMHDVSLYLVLLIAVSTLGPLQFGFHLAELNAPQDVLTCRKKSISTKSTMLGWVHSKSPQTAPGGWLPECIPMTDAVFATVSSIFTVGGLVGALCAGPFSSKRGRRPAMRVTALLYIVGAVIETLAGGAAALAIGRFFTGAAGGASTVIVPLYISEIAPPKERGLFGAMTQVSINVGILTVQTLGYFFSYGKAWRWILASGIFIALAQASGLLLIPESPAWLAANGDVPNARRTLQRIRGKGFDIKEEVAAWDTSDVSAEQEGLLAQSNDAPPASLSSHNKGSPVHLGFFEVVKEPLYRPAIAAVVGIMFAQQLCGINSVIMYSVSLLTGLLPVSSALLTIFISIVNLITTAACSPLPDKLGRKKCILISIIGQGTSSLILAFSILFGIKILSAISVVSFVAFFAVGLGPVPFILASELVGQEAVGATQSWSLGSNYIATFLVAQFFPIINKAFNQLLGGAGWVYFLFAGFALLFALFVAVKVPETKGKKDADEVWGRTRRLD